jgi:acyl carrier protein
MPKTLLELYAVVSPVAEQVLQIPRFDSTLTMMSTPSWDSLRHVQLLGAIERKFGIEIAGEDAFKLTSADKLVSYLHARLELGGQT